MRYKVSRDFKGVLICKHFNRALQAGNSIEISDALLWEPEVERLIQREILIPSDGQPTYVKQTPSAPPVQAPVSVPPPSVKTVQTPEKQVDDTPEFKPKIWNFREAKIENANPIFDKRETIQIDLNDESQKEEVEVDGETQIIEIKKDKSKTIKIDGNKIEENVPKTRKVTSNDKAGIVPVGDVKPPLTTQDAMMELDSRGRPLKNASDHMIENYNVEDISFVDQEQVIEKVNKIKRK